MLFLRHLYWVSWIKHAWLEITDLCATVIPWGDWLCCTFIPHIHLPKKCRQCNNPASHRTPYNAHLLTGEGPKQHTLDIFERHLIKSINSKYLWLESWKKVIPGNSLTCWPRENKQYAQPFKEWCHTEVVPHTGSFHLCWLCINHSWYIKTWQYNGRPVHACC